MKIIRIIFAFFVVNILLFNVVYGIPSDITVNDSQAVEVLKNYNIIDNSTLENENISRAECIIAILKVIGESPGIKEEYEKSEYYIPIFNDLEENNYYSGYILAAGYNNIALGEPGFDDYHYNFCPNRKVTVKEAVTFIVRCLQPLPDNKKDVSKISIDETYSKGKDTGILKETDEFYSNGDSLLTPNEFCILLHRLLYQNRYVYFEKDFYPIRKMDTSKYIDHITKAQ